MRRHATRNLNPAAVLLCLRDHDALKLGDLLRMLEVPSGSNGFAAQNRLFGILEQLEGVGLVSWTGPKMNGRLALEVTRSPEEPILAATPFLGQLQKALEVSLAKLSTEVGPSESELAETLRAVEDELARAIPSAVPYRIDFLKTLEEIRTCFEAECYIAVLGLSGKCLEICLKIRLKSAGKTCPGNATIGELLSEVGKLDGEYRDPALNNVANVINQSRIPAVHAKEQVPIPSREQAAMVVNAVLDVVNRTFAEPG